MLLLSTNTRFPVSRSWRARTGEAKGGVDQIIRLFDASAMKRPLMVSNSFEDSEMGAFGLCVQMMV